MGQNGTKLAPFEEEQLSTAPPRAGAHGHGSSSGNKDRWVVAPSRPAPPAPNAAQPPVVVVVAAAQRQQSKSPPPLSEATSSTATSSSGSATATASPPATTAAPAKAFPSGPAKLQKSPPKDKAAPLPTSLSSNANRTSSASSSHPLQVIQSPPQVPPKRGLSLVRKMSFRSRERGTGAVQAATSTSASQPPASSGGHAAAAAAAVASKSVSTVRAPSPLAAAISPSAAIAATAGSRGNSAADNSTTAHARSQSLQPSRTQPTAHSSRHKRPAGLDEPVVGGAAVGPSKPRVLMRSASTGHKPLPPRPIRSAARSSPQRDGSLELPPVAESSVVDANSAPQTSKAPRETGIEEHNNPEKRQRLVPRSPTSGASSASSSSQHLAGGGEAQQHLASQRRGSVTARREREWRAKLATLTVAPAVAPPSPLLDANAGPRPPPRRRPAPSEVAGSSETSPILAEFGVATQATKQQAVETLVHTFGGLGLGGVVTPKIGARNRLPSVASVVSSLADSHISPAVSAVGRNHNERANVARSVSTGSYLDSASYFESGASAASSKTSKAVSPSLLATLKVPFSESERRPLSPIIQSPTLPASPTSPAFTLALSLASPGPPRQPDLPSTPATASPATPATPSITSIALSHERTPPPLPAPSSASSMREWMPDARVVVSRSSVPDLPKQTHPTAEKDTTARPAPSRDSSKAASSKNSSPPGSVSSSRGGQTLDFVPGPVVPRAEALIPMKTAEVKVKQSSPPPQPYLGSHFDNDHLTMSPPDVPGDILPFNAYAPKAERVLAPVKPVAVAVVPTAAVVPVPAVTSPTWPSKPHTAVSTPVVMPVAAPVLPSRGAALAKSTTPSPPPMAQHPKRSASSSSPDNNEKERDSKDAALRPADDGREAAMVSINHENKRPQGHRAPSGKSGAKRHERKGSREVYAYDGKLNGAMMAMAVDPDTSSEAAGLAARVREQREWECDPSHTPLKRMYCDLTPGLDSGRRPRKTGLPMADLQRWIASTSTTAAYPTAA